MTNEVLKACNFYKTDLVTLLSRFTFLGPCDDTELITAPIQLTVYSVCIYTETNPCFSLKCLSGYARLTWTTLPIDPWSYTKPDAEWYSIYLYCRMAPCLQVICKEPGNIKYRHGCFLPVSTSLHCTWIWKSTCNVQLTSFLLGIKIHHMNNETNTKNTVGSIDAIFE